MSDDMVVRVNGILTSEQAAEQVAATLSEGSVYTVSPPDMQGMVTCIDRFGPNDVLQILDETGQPSLGLLQEASESAQIYGVDVVLELSDGRAILLLNYAESFADAVGLSGGSDAAESAGHAAVDDSFESSDPDSEEDTMQTGLLSDMLGLEDVGPITGDVATVSVTDAGELLRNSPDDDGGVL